MWQPIETAPKDEPLLGFSGGKYFAIHWTSPQRVFGDGRESDIEQWWSIDGDDLSGVMAPTHWMPLPAPPTTT